MTEIEFLKKLHHLLQQIDDDWDFGEEINGKAKEMELLCHNFIEVKKMQLDEHGNQNKAK